MNRFPFSDRYSKNNRNRIYRPVWIAGEKYTNMINSFEKFDDPDFANLRLSVVDDKTFEIIADDIGSFVKYNDDIDGYRIAWTIDSFPDITPGFYRLLLYNTVNDQAKYISNQHEVLDKDIDFKAFTSYFEYRHSAEIYNYGYDELTSFKIRVRLHLNVLNVEQTFDIEEYEEVTTGKSQNPRFDVDKVVTIETELYDLLAHDAFAIFLAHNDKMINGQVITIAPGGKYAGEKSPVESPVWNKNVDVKIQDFSTINKQ